MTLAIILIAVAALAFANGANDNFKGVATLFGSGTTSFRGALVWATLATLGGSLAAVLFAGQLLKSFSGKGLVADTLVSDPIYVAAVALGAGATVLIATKFCLPVSTTHGLIGALVGAGWAADSTINAANLVGTFLVPLLLSPVIAIAAAAFVYLVAHAGRVKLGVTEETCFCVGSEVVEVATRLAPAMALERVEQLTVSIGNAVTCRNRYQGKLVGIDVATVLDSLHFVSAGLVSFARGLNDTPKIAALLLVAPLFGGFSSVAAVGTMIAIGGLVAARAVAETMSRKITTMNHGQGFAANLVTAMLVIGATGFGWPVSTTHVSCGALFGIGTINRQAQFGTIARIVGAWLTTLPAGAALGAASFWALGRITQA